MDGGRERQKYISSPITRYGLDGGRERQKYAQPYHQVWPGWRKRRTKIYPALSLGMAWMEEEKDKNMPSPITRYGMDGGRERQKYIQPYHQVWPGWKKRKTKICPALSSN